MELSISVIIRSKNEETTIAKTLEIIKSQTTKPQEIIVVDNESTDGTVNIARNYGCRVVNISNNDFSHTASCNLGATEAKGDLLVFTNGHSYPISNEWLKLGKAHFQSDDQLAGVYSFPFFDDRASVWERMVGIYSQLSGSYQNLKNHGEPSIFDIGLMGTACAILRRDLWQKYPFNENISSHGGEDSDWGFHYLNLGYHIIRDPKFAVFHCHGDNLVRFLKRYSMYYYTGFIAYSKCRPFVIKS